MSDTNHNEERERLTKFALRAYEKLPGNRAYALDEQGAMALGALACAWHERGNKLDNSDGGGEDQFGEVLKKLGAFTNLFQQQAAEPKPLRKMWADPITGQLLKNPFSSATQNLSAQKLIMERDPDLAAALKKSAENPWQFVADLQDEAARLERLKAISYGEKEKAENPFITGDLEGQGQLARLDPMKAELFRREAKQVSLPFTPGSINQTVRGQLSRKDAPLFELTERAHTIQKKQIDQDLADTREAEARATEKRKAIEARLEKQQQKSARPLGEV